jgi:hypothetical protein
MLAEKRAVVSAKNEVYCFCVRVTKITYEIWNSALSHILLCTSLILDSTNVERGT